MDVIETGISGLVILEPRVFGDSRGFFMETYNQTRYGEVGIAETFVQDNLSFSTRGILRGLHFQNPGAQGKLVQVLQGEVFDVAVDIRPKSATFGEWRSVILNTENHRQFYVPPGFAHGFAVTSEQALFCYKCTDFYNPSGEHTLMWDDPDLGIDWPISAPELSDKDKKGLYLKDLPTS